MGKRIEQRREKILNAVNTYGSLDFEQLRAMFPGISDVTLRKDLQYLDDTQQANRTHGGIKSIPSVFNYFYRANVNRNLKKIIAQKAAALIQPGESIFISAGTTCAELARCLPLFPLKVCSDGIYTISSISALPNISVEILGGDVDLNIMRVEGISALDYLENMHFSTAFMGSIGLNPQYGFAHSSAMTTTLLSKVASRSDRTVVLLDSTKINFAFSPYCLPVSAVDILVTDDILPEEMSNQLKASGIEII